VARKEYAFYPGCSSQLRASASNYLVSVNAMCETLDVKLTPIPDWNCCTASIAYADSSELSRHVMNARNFALAETHLPGQDIVAGRLDLTREPRECLGEDYATHGRSCPDSRGCWIAHQSARAARVSRSIANR